MSILSGILLNFLPKELMWVCGRSYSDSHFKWRDNASFQLILELPYL